MSGPFKTLVVTGHTLTFEVRVPPHAKVDGGRYETIHRTRLGACLVSRLAKAAGITDPKFLKPKPDKGGRRVVWTMGWTPGDESTWRTADKPPEALRVQRADDVTYGSEKDGFPPVGTSRFPKGVAHQQTAVYTYLDVCSPYSDDATELVPAAAGFVLVHLTNTDGVSNTDRDRLLPFIRGVTTKPPSGRTTVLLVGDRVLNALGFPMTEDRSWEAFADDCVRELLPPPAGRPHASNWIKDLREALARFDHVIVRHNPYAAVHFRWLPPLAQQRATLHYLVYPKRQFSSHPGHIRGINDVLGASVAAAVMAGKGDSAVAVDDGIAAGLLRCSRFDEKGYHDKDKPAGFAPTQLEDIVGATAPADRWVSEVVIPGHDADLRPAAWSVLDLHLRRERWQGTRARAVAKPEESRARALRLGVAIVRHGLAKVQKEGLENPDEWVAQRLPAVRFGKLQVVDRQAFEDVHEIRGAMVGYLNHFRDETSPLCLAMFGPPGGGKSFAVKQLAESLGHPALHLPAYEVNVSQYDKAEDLTWVFSEVRTLTQGGKVPLVFFDEFDAARDNRPFGWQQTFLAPMQDGKFGQPPHQIVYRNGIFVFVGGVNHSFDGITGRARNRGFIEAKGPDFVSRLVRHLNVLGISPDDDKPDDFTFVVRRAVLLRDLLFKFQRGLFQSGEDGRAEVEDEVVAALLTVPCFRHGVRSLEAIVRTSRLHPDRPRLHWGALPPDSQLDMHVDVADLKAARLKCHPS